MREISKKVLDIVTTNLNKGISTRKTAKELQNKLDMDRELAMDLATTSTAYIRTLNTLEGYKKSNVVDKVKIMCHETNCNGCNGRILDKNECNVGVNIPPMKKRCAGCIAPYFE